MFNRGDDVRGKIKVPKVSKFCSVSKLCEWKIDLGDSFEAGDVICVIDNLNEKHEIKAEKAGMLVEKTIYDNSIVEDSQVIGIFEISPDEEADISAYPVSGMISKVISRLKELRECY